MKCSAENCSDDYIGESARRIIERIKDHGEGVTKSPVLKHSSDKEHVEVTQKDFKVIGSYFTNNSFKGRSLIKQESSTLNV